MNDYSKWDNIRDSDEEDESKARQPEPFDSEEVEKVRKDQELVERWLRKQITQLQRGEVAHRPPELRELAPYRKATKEERQVLAMLIVISHFEEGKTNLDRHPQLLELVRHHRWLEEDPGTLELLCRVQQTAMRKGKGGDGDGGATIQEDPEEARLRDMCMSGINTLAAPKKAKCVGGLLELVTLICTPATDNARELRKKWQKKEFAKDALFESLFPDLRNYQDEISQDMGMKEVWVILAVLFLLIIVVFLIMYGPSMPVFVRSPLPAPAPSRPAHETAEL
mmetsp:Transcript_40140/g.93247  ORF Transcript_40140/g.93247 Transcript_40140/m.93247 type:complete len:281 (-) Transcript_40140:61-903(-)